jgi:hypothetical protein
MGTMLRIAAFAFAFSTGLTASFTVAPATKPVETAVADWVAAIDGASGWSANINNVTYDKATDTAVVTGLTIAYAPISLSVSFQPITIVGYAETSDGTFGAETVATDGATATGEGFEASLAGIRYEGVGNLKKDFDRLAAWDPQRPFTSLMQAYARFRDIRLTRAAIDSLSVTTDKRGEQALLKYEDIAIEGWADGEIARITTGALTIAAAGVADPVSITVAGTESRGIGYTALLRIYDPDQYVGGVGDGIWRNAAEFVGYDRIVFDTPEAKVTFGKLRIEDFRVRQPERSFNAFFDRAFLNPQDQNEPTPEELRAIFGYLSSFAIGSMSLQDVAVEAEDGGTGHLGQMRLVDASAERIGEFSLTDIAVSPPDRGNIAIGRLGVGGIVFPPLAAVVEAAEAEEAGRDFDYGRLATQMAFLEGRTIDVNVPDSPRIRLDKARLDLGNYVGPTPTAIALDVAGVDLTAAAIDDPKTRAMWQALGYDHIRGDFGARLAWNESDESVTIDDFRFAVDGVGAMSLSAVLTGLSREALGNIEILQGAFAGLSFVRGTLSLENYDVLDRWIDHQAAMTGGEPAALRRQLAVMLAEITTGVGNADFQEQLRQVLETAVMAPGSITASATPAAPVPLAALGLLAQSAPASLPDLLGLAIESRAAGKP